MKACPKWHFAWVGFWLNEMQKLLKYHNWGALKGKLVGGQLVAGWKVNWLLSSPPELNFQLGFSFCMQAFELCNNCVCHWSPHIQQRLQWNLRLKTPLHNLWKAKGPCKVLYICLFVWHRFEVSFCWSGHASSITLIKRLKGLYDLSLKVFSKYLCHC